MADDLQDLGSTPIWRPSINWRRIPKYDYDGGGRRIIGYTGTTKQVFNTSDEKPQINEFQVSMFNKAAEKAIVDQFIALKGRHARFWQLLPINLFTLNGTHASGVTTLTVKRNEFDYRGFERFYILLTSNDLITRAIADYQVDEVNDTADIIFNASTDRLLNPADIVIFSLLLLVRLDNDVLRLQYRTDRVPETALRTIELVKEYDLV